MLEWATGKPKCGQHRLKETVARRYVHLPDGVGGINLLRNDKGMNLQSLHLANTRHRKYTDAVRLVCFVVIYISFLTYTCAVAGLP